jgi:hypothetical protein|tara:strand:+ start:64 stop:252 length:189 start_codon:yes stop_codon:yes gene_type:complete
MMSFLSIEDRNVLRRVVHTVHMKHMPKHLLTNYEADKLIDSFLPETVEKLVKAGKDNHIDRL